MAIDNSKVAGRTFGTDVTKPRSVAKRANPNATTESKNIENQNNPNEDVAAEIGAKEEKVSTPETPKRDAAKISSEATETTGNTEAKPVKEEKPKKRTKKTVSNNKDNKKEAVLENANKEKLKKTKQLGVSVTPTLYKAIQELLQSQQKSVSSLGYDLLKDYMKERLSSIEKRVAFQQELNDGTVITTITPEELELLKAELSSEEK